ncbi:MAG: VWA domain-containing protein [Bacteroidia bacterium]|nr:VWA domain-containing protein [Bacteroidia bacterium]
MLKFAHPEALYLFLLLPLLAGGFLWFLAQRRRAWRRLADRGLHDRLAPLRPAQKHTWKWALVTAGLACLIIALANPQIGRKYEKAKRRGIDLMIALDISRSMDAEDVPPSRFQQARQLAVRLLERLSGDRVGLIVFAGNAYLQAPVTTDYTAIRSLLRTLSTESAPTQGTAVGEAIRTASRAFDQVQAPSRVLLLLSDGENHLGNAVEAATEARENGLIIFALGIGTPGGANIPEWSGDRRAGFKTDENGQPVLTRLDENLLQQVAAASGGRYFRIGQSDELDEVVRALGRLQQQEYEELQYSDYEDQFQWFLALGLLLLSLEAWMSERRTGWFSGIASWFNSSRT